MSVCTFDEYFLSNNTVYVLLYYLFIRLMISALVSLSPLDSVETENTKPTERPITINNLGFVLVFVNMILPLVLCPCPLPIANMDQPSD